MRLRTFERRAVEELLALPEPLRAGVQGPVVHRRARRHGSLPGRYTLGMCVPVPIIGDPAGDHLSTIFLWYGSFIACAMRDPEFDLEAELRETVRHEVRHHIEDRAGIPDLHEEDLVEEEHARLLAGRAFRPGFWRLGEPAGDDAWGVGDDLFVEVRLSGAERARARRDGLDLVWRGVPLRLSAEDLAPGAPPVAFDGVLEDGVLWIVAG